MFARNPLLDESLRTARRHKNLFDASGLRRPFSLRSSVGFGPRANRRKDTSLVESALEGSGYLPAGRRPTGHMSRPLDTAMRQFQRDNRLDADGLITPDGPTLQRLARTFGQEVAESTHNLAKPRTMIPAVKAEAFSENARTVQHLMGSGEDGLFPTLLSDAFRSGRSGQAEVVDFFVQLRQRDPDRARVIREKTGSSLNTAQESLLDDLIDDLATQRAEEADILTRKDTEEDGKEPDPIPDDGEGGEDEKPPAEPEQPDPEEEKPEPPQDEPNCMNEWVDARQAVQEVYAVIKEIHDTNREITKKKEQLANLESQITEQIANLALDLAGTGLTIASASAPLIILQASKAGIDISKIQHNMDRKDELLLKISDLEESLDPLNEKLKKAEQKEAELNEVLERCNARKKQK